MAKMDVLIINDGTPDRSAEMSREYVNRFPGVFRQIDKENGGHGSVWNLGLKEAYGKYTRFLDSDDWLENLDLLIEKLETCDADLVITPTLCHCPNEVLWKQEILDMEFGKVYDADTFDWLHNRSHGNYVFHHSCTYKTEMFRQYLPLFLEKQPYDDVVLGVASKIGAKSLVAYDFILYHYLMDREGQSISLEVQRKNIAAKIKTEKHTINFVETHPVDESSTKFEFFKEKLPKMYNYGYRGFFDLPYEENKKLTKEWDEWVRVSNSKMKTPFIRLYRLLPFRIYLFLIKTLLKK
jgi:glycosyltransferase involved in cell wall biosynthesis